MSRDQDITWLWNQPLPGSPARMIQSDTIATGMNAVMKTASESRGQPHFVQPPSNWDSAISKPAPATRPTRAQYPPIWSLLICVANQIRKPAAAENTSVVVARVSPYIRSPR